MNQHKITELPVELQWLRDNAIFIAARPIEAAIGMPDGTLRKFIVGARPLPAHWHGPVIAWVQEFIQLEKADYGHPFVL